MKEILLLLLIFVLFYIIIDENSPDSLLELLPDIFPRFIHKSCEEIVGSDKDKKKCADLLEFNSFIA